MQQHHRRPRDRDLHAGQHAHNHTLSHQQQLHLAQLGGHAATANLAALNAMLQNPLGGALNHQAVVAHINNHHSQFNYMYSDGSEEEVDSEG